MAGHCQNAELGRFMGLTQHRALMLLPDREILNRVTFETQDLEHPKEQFFWKNATGQLDTQKDVGRLAILGTSDLDSSIIDSHFAKHSGNV